MKRYRCSRKPIQIPIMATSVRLIRRYVWLIDTIRRAGRLTLDEVNDRWLDTTSLNPDHESKIPERTFHRHREAIADLFGIDIECDRSDGNTYYISNPEALEESSFTSWLFNGLSIENQMMDNEDVKQRVIFEKSIGGVEYVSVIIDAIANNQVLSITYKRFNQSSERKFEVEPYLLKQSRQRWYLLGNFVVESKLMTFALDRITSLTPIKKSFEWDETIGDAHYFDDVIGTNVDDDYDCEEVQIRVYGHQRAYFESLPMHESQRLIEQNDDYSDYAVNVRPEYEFQRELLRLGPDAEVLSPQWLRDEMVWLNEEALKRYKSW